MQHISVTPRCSSQRQPVHELHHFGLCPDALCSAGVRRGGGQRRQELAGQPEEVHEEGLKGQAMSVMQGLQRERESEREEGGEKGGGRGGDGDQGRDKGEAQG